MSSTTRKLHHYFEDALLNHGDNIYIKTANEENSFKSIYDLAVYFTDVLLNEGIQKGDRIVIYSSKNEFSIAMMIACSKCEVIYVPVSSINPSHRAKFIIEETNAHFIFCDKNCSAEIQKSGIDLNLIHSSNQMKLFSRSMEARKKVSDDAAFILFTSGSTGTPKGVVISHSAAISFIDWAADEFCITNKDVLVSIAPFNFDLSVFDIYVTVKKFATLVLYSEDETKNALLMAQRISLDKATTIYATPTFYSTLAYYGKLNKYDYSLLKNVLFAGEVFHLEVFKELLSYWPGKKYANLYGPTETNVCTYCKIDLKKIDYSVFPIGKKCDYAQLLIFDENGKVITDHTHGELLVGGESLFNEYWNDPEKTQSSFLMYNNSRYYKTGDIVYKNENDDLVYVSRKDRMIKKNGYRIEPSEIEKAMLSFPNVTNSAVVFLKDNNQLICFLESKNREGTIELKKFCQNYLPSYMIPDKFIFLDSMPKTSSGKVDLEALKNRQ